MTGNRGRINENDIASLRESGLAHVLAISGLHMSLIAGSIFILVRVLFALWPRLALTRPIKKWAALIGVAGGAIYLLISGSAIATQRAFIMITVMFVAVCLNRPAITLRNVALTGLAFLIPWPETLFDTSFQMSFAAVVALVAFYEALAKREVRQPRATKMYFPLQKLFRIYAMLIFTTCVASLAVAPFAAYHFHKLAQYSLPANLIAMPVVSLCVMPAALISFLAMPFSLEHLPLQVMGFGIDLLLGTAKTVSNWQGATYLVPAFPVSALVAISLGGIWICLWAQKWRMLGLLPIALGLMLGQYSNRPDILISQEGKTVAVRSAQGTLEALQVKSEPFDLDEWLKADGDVRTSKEIENGKYFFCDDVGCVARVKGQTIALTRHPAAISEDCSRADIVIFLNVYARKCTGPRVVITKKDLKRSGAHAIYLDGQSIRTSNVSSERGRRPWVRMQPNDRPLSPPTGAFANDGN